MADEAVAVQVTIFQAILAELRLQTALLQKTYDLLNDPVTGIKVTPGSNS